MIEDEKEVVAPSTNDYGMSDEDYQKERQAIRAQVRGEKPDEAPAEVVVEKEEPKEVVEEPQKAAPAKPKVEVVEEDFIQQLPDEYKDLKEKITSQLQLEREKAAKAISQRKSDDGRVAAYQRHYEEAKREREEAVRQLALLKQAPQKSLKDATTPLLKEAAEFDPKFVDTLDEMRAQLKEEYDAQIAQLRTEMSSQVAPIYEEREHQRVQHFTQELESYAPNWKEVVYAVDDNGQPQKDANGVPMFSDGWAHCIREQPPELQQAMLNVQTPEGAKWALDTYKTWGVRNGYFDADPTPAAAIPNADAIQQKRKQDLTRSAPVKSNTVPLSTNPTEQWDNEKWVAAERHKIREAIRSGKLHSLQ